MIVSKEYLIHVHDTKTTLIIKCVQDDSGRQIVLRLVDMTLPSTCSARIYARKPSKLVVYNDMTVDTAANTVTLDITNQMIAELGDTLAQVVVTSGEETVTSFTFILRVYEKLLDENAIESTDEFGALTEAIAELDTIRQTIGSAITNAQIDALFE